MTGVVCLVPLKGKNVFEPCPSVKILVPVRVFLKFPMSNPVIFI